jgi:hypothetical protein
VNSASFFKTQLQGYFCEGFSDFPSWEIWALDILVLLIILSSSFNLCYGLSPPKLMLKFGCYFNGVGRWGSLQSDGVIKRDQCICLGTKLLRDQISSVKAVIIKQVFHTEPLMLCLQHTLLPFSIFTMLGCGMRPSPEAPSDLRLPLSRTLNLTNFFLL